MDVKERYAIEKNLKKNTIFNDIFPQSFTIISIYFCRFLTFYLYVIVFQYEAIFSSFDMDFKSVPSTASNKANFVEFRSQIDLL